MKKEANKSIIILYILIFLIIAFDAFYYIKFINNEKWQCSQIACTKIKAAQEWINENCAKADKKTMCNVIINDTKQLVPLEMINQQSLNQCIQVACIQEIKVRFVNYTLNITS